LKTMSTRLFWRNGGCDLEEATGPYATLLMQHPDTLYSDLVRLKMEGRLEDPF